MIRCKKFPVCRAFHICCVNGSKHRSNRVREILVNVSLATSAHVHIYMAGAMCLWSGVGKLLEKNGAMGLLSKLLSPILGRIFPDSREDGLLRGYLCGNICANLLGLGNAATPMGIQAAKRLKTPGSDAASDQLCRLVVLNTASIQLLPTNVAAVRAALGCGRPFDILPAVWVTSILSAGLGVCAAMLLGRVRKA